MAEHLREQLSAAERTAMTKPPTTNLQAYNLYLEAKELIEGSMASKDSAATLKEAVLLLDEATRRDPTFVLAYCELAQANEDLYWNEMDRTPERLEMAKQALDAAGRIGPDLGETHLARARYHYMAFRDYATARTELELARRSLP